ncbi:MAG TPA: ABC transporter permease [Terriglobales bacterium]|nr:ABC transporter permease [Terriglobales bacterium]
MPRWSAKLRLRLRSLLLPGRVQRELDEEIQDHLRREAELAGAAEALRRFAAGGNLDAVRETCRDQRRVAAVENFVQDARRALRRLAAAPGFTLTALAALGFGLAAATAMFGLCDAVLLRPLPGVSAGGLAHLERYDGAELLGDFSYPDYQDYRALSRSYGTLAAASNFDFDITSAAGTETVPAELVSGNYFATLGVGAELGRTLLPGDEPAGANQVAVVSDRYWRTRMGADPAALGRAIEANHTALTLVGVAAPGFRGSTQTWGADLFIPITLQPTLAPMGGTGENCLVSRFCGWITILGRLAPGIPLRQAQAETTTVAARIAAAHPGLKSRQARVVAGLGSWSDDRASQSRFLTLLLAGALLLAAMTSASLGSLFLARMGARQHEVATQLALGAGRGRVARQYLLEAAWIAGAGGCLGVLLAGPAARWLLALSPNAPANLPAVSTAHVAAFAFGLAVVCTVAMAGAPALLVARGGRIAAALQQGGRAASAARHRAQRALLSVQVGLALLLLIAAGLAARTLQAATAGEVPPAAAHTVLAMLDTGHASYTRAQSAAFYRRLQGNLAAQSGFTRVALTSCLAPAPCNRGPVFLAGTEPSETVMRSREFAEQYLRPDISWVSPEYFSVFDLPLLGGRSFTGADRSGAPLVCMINRRLAERLWPHQAALGQRLAWPQFNFAGGHDFTVVGIVADRRSESLLQAPPYAVYVPEAQAPFARMWVAAQTSLATAAALAVIRSQVASLDSRLPVIHGRTLAEQVRMSLWQPLAIASLAGLFGLLAAALAAIGLFGTLAQFVIERRRELGIRLVLGATPGGLARRVLGDALAPIGAGLMLGGLAAAAGARLLLPWLFGVAPFDPTTWLAASTLLAFTALAASALAAVRAARLPANTALRGE